MQDIGNYDSKYILKSNWKENTQYTIVCDIYSDAISGNIGFSYTDGTSSYIENLSTNKWTKLVLTSSANKTLKYIRAVWQSNYTYIDLDTFMVLEGAYTADTLPDYVPYQEKTVTFPFGEQKLCRKSNTEYDYLSDEGIVNVLEQTDNTGTKTIEESFSLRETPLVTPYTIAQQTAYNNLQNLILFEGYNYIEMTSSNGVKANLTVDYTKSTKMVINDIEERLSVLEYAGLEG